MEAPSEPISRQRRVGAASREDTARRLLDAAHEEFVERGYVGATVARIAARAGVTVQTLYLAWGSKRALLRADLERSLAGRAAHPGRVVDRFAGLAPAQVVEMMADAFVEIASRSALGWSLYRDAAAVDAEVATDWAELQQARRATLDAVVGHIPRAALRRGLTRDAAADTAWALVSPDCYALMTTHGGYSRAQFRDWLAKTLAAALLR